MQIGVSSGREELIPEQERNMFRIHVVVSGVRYDAHERRAGPVKNVN
jgi:hypothetical protein